MAEPRKRLGQSGLPVNNLTKRQPNTSQTPSAPPPKRVYFPSASSAPSVVTISSSPPAPTARTGGPQTYNLSEQSDELYDGIRYGTSPKKGLRTLLDMASSPVKANERTLEPSPRAVPVAAPMLRPVQKNPGVLDTWISRLEGTPDSETPATPQDPSIQSNEAPGETPQGSDSDPFSDDDSFIISLTQKPGSPRAPKTDDTSSFQFSSSAPASPKAQTTTSERPQTPTLANTPSLKPESPKQSVPASTQSPKIPHQLTSPAKYDIKFDREHAEYTPEAVSAACAFSRPNFARYVITGIRNAPLGPDRPQLVVKVCDAEDQQRTILIRGEYTDLGLAVNDIVHVIVTDPSRPYMVDDTTNLLIWHPDVLVSATNVAGTMYCPRKVVLNSRYKFPGEPSAVMIRGLVVHEVFQQCLAAGGYSEPTALAAIDTELANYTLDLWLIEVEPSAIKQEIVSDHLPFISQFFARYWRHRGGSAAAYGGARTHSTVRINVTKVAAIEESVWSPMFGLRGYIDASVVAETAVGGARAGPAALLPMEVKTGRPQLSHNAQASLYSLLFKDRHQLDIGAFLLAYTKTSELAMWDINPADMRSLINMRNRAAAFLRAEAGTELPPILGSSTCERCEVQAGCMAIYEMSDAGDPRASGLPPEVYGAHTAHLSMEDADFFEHWNRLLTIEERQTKKQRQLVWTRTADQRQQEDGGAVGHLRVASQGHGLVTLVGDFRGAGFGDETWVSVSTEDNGGHFGLVDGTVVEMTADKAVVRCSRLPELDQSLSYRLDTNPMYSGLDLARYNLLDLFLATTPDRRRRLIVDNDPPKFHNQPLFEPDIEGLNADQAAAMRLCLRADDYAVVLGMPGTGKTTLLARLVGQLAAQGRSVLLCSYTHSAVDNVLMRLPSNVRYLRVARQPSRVHPKVRPSVPPTNFRTKEMFLAEYSAPVVGATCLALNDLAFMVRQRFDYCIVDEAAQITLPVCLGPLRLADRFILVGDHHQLPPLVTAPDADVRQQLAQSLFARLADAHPDAVAELRVQYRMNAAIMAMSNHLVYSQALSCGSAAIAERQLAMSSDWESGLAPWVREAVDPARPVVFVDHHNVASCRERRSGPRQVDNPGEAAMVVSLVAAFVAGGVAVDDIGVMALNRAQIRLLQRAVAPFNNLEVLTADQYQGREKEVVIVSMARSNDDGSAGDLVREWRRLNVAFSRAKVKLVVVGSKPTLARAPTMANVLRLIEKIGSVVTLDSGDVSVSPGGSPVKKRAKTSRVNPGPVVARENGW
ncbi:DNA replication ATP-dependent helicase/nuclease Dna2p [Diutina catenulata]